VISNSVKQLVHGKLSRWQGELIPMSRSWVEKELGDLSGEDRTIARFALVLAKASYQIDDKMVEDVLGKDRNEGFLSQPPDSSSSKSPINRLISYSVRLE